MLNPALGACEDVDGRTSIVTRKGADGHAVYGPYEMISPGRHIVEFSMRLADGGGERGDVVCAVIDVVHDSGNQTLARRKITLADLADGAQHAFALPFRLGSSARLEYRVWVSGKASLVIDGHRRAVAAPDKDDASDAQRVAAGRFPGSEADAVPFFHENLATFRTLYEEGASVTITNEAVVLTVEGVSLYARMHDDMMFIGEVFRENAYNFGIDRPVCVIDIGMNIGLASLLFASKDEVSEVHSFEPFKSTYDRAVANLSLNPAFAHKVTARNFGLSDRDFTGTILVSSAAGSGAMSTVGAADGEATKIELRDAGSYLRPIIEQARAAGLAIVMKVDCEGSEFAIFDSLAKHDLFGQISAFMVEWHAMFDTKTQQDLLAPLRANGFLVFDRSPPAGNGFFYAARLESASAA
jgi:FkbM family methyltransferase